MDEKNNEKLARTVQLRLNLAAINSSFTGFGSGERNFAKHLFLKFFAELFLWNNYILKQAICRFVYPVYILAKLYRN